MWWHTSVILVPRELRQRNCEFEASVGKLVGSCLEKKRGRKRRKGKKRKRQDREKHQVSIDFLICFPGRWNNRLMRLLSDTDSGPRVIPPYKVSILCIPGHGLPDVLASFMST